MEKFTTAQEKANAARTQGDLKGYLAAVEDMRGAVTKLEAKRDAAMAEIEANLTDEQMAEIDATLADMNESIASAEAKLAEVKAEAKAAAESALKQLKEELVSEHKVTVTVQ